MISPDGPAKHGTDEVILLDEVIEQVQPPLERLPAATPLEDRRRLIRLGGHAHDDSRGQAAVSAWLLVHMS